MAKKRKQFIADLLSKTRSELRKMLATEQRNLFDLRMKNSVRGLKQTHLIKNKRKDVARIQTVMNQKQLETSS